MALGVFKSQTPQGAPDWSGLMAATLIAALPVLVLFVVFGKGSSTPSASPASSDASTSRQFPTIRRTERRTMNEEPHRRLASALPLPRCLPSSACGGGSSGDRQARQRHSGEINYWLWDANQLPAYQQCADDFTKANPDITVKITQRGWDDYWTTLTNGFVAGTAPDVFTDHLAKYPRVRRARSSCSPWTTPSPRTTSTLTIYTEGLADLWVGQDGKRYGLPKDWDTVALFYNKKHGQRRRRHRGADGEPRLEPGGRRHLREGHRAT